MKRYLTIVVIVLIIIASQSSAAIVRSAKTYNFMDFYAGSASILGEYDEVGVGDYQVVITNQSGFPINLEGDEIYDGTAFLGIRYGQLRGNHLQYTISFQFTRVALSNEWERIYSSDGTYDDPKFSIYDLALDVNYYFMNPLKTSIAPFIGGGVKGGLFRNEVKGFEASSELIWLANLNFGAEATIWRSVDEMTSLSLLSTNEYQFAASDVRPKYLQIGFGLRYYFRY